MKEGDSVAWEWGNGVAEGVIKSVHTERVSIKSKGSTISRNGSDDNPAIVIKHKSGNDVLKLVSEVQKTSKDDE